MFYERFLTLCKGKGITPSAAATQAGFNKGTVSVWKKKYEAGVDVRPEKDIMDKICSFFNCTEAWLIGADEQEKKPTPISGGEHDYEDWELAQSVMQADDQTKEVIRLLLKRQ